MRFFAIGLAVFAVTVVVVVADPGEDLVTLTKSIPFDDNVTAGKPVGYQFFTNGTETHISVRLIRRITFELMESDLGICVTTDEKQKPCDIAYAAHEFEFNLMTGQGLTLYAWVAVRNYNDTVPYTVMWCTSCASLCPNECTARGACLVNGTCACDPWLDRVSTHPDCSTFVVPSDPTAVIIALVVILSLVCVLPVVILIVGRLFFDLFVDEIPCIPFFRSQKPKYVKQKEPDHDALPADAMSKVPL